MNQSEKNLLKLTVGSFVVGLVLSRQHGRIRALKADLRFEKFRSNEAQRLMQRAIMKLDNEGLTDFQEELAQDIEFLKIVM